MPSPKGKNPSDETTSTTSRRNPSDESDPTPLSSAIGSPKRLHHRDTKLNRTIHPFDPHKLLASDFPQRYWQDGEDVVAPVYTFPITSDHQLAKNWSETGQAIVAYLARRQIEWYSVGLFQRSQNGIKDGVATVIITVANHQNLPRGAAKDIHLLCQDAFLEIVTDEIRRCDDERDERSEPLKIPFDSRLSMGASIGISGSTSTGTLGGYLEVVDVDGKTVQTCALTCHHVLLHLEPKNHGDKLSKPDLGDRGFWRPGLQKLEVSSPSDEDIDIAYQSNVKTLHEVEGELAVIESKFEMLGDDAPNTLHRKQQYLISIRDVHKKQLQFLDQTRTDAGTVFAKSGYSVSTTYNCQLDWGLITIHPDRTGSNATSLDRSKDPGFNFDVAEVLTDENRNPGEDPIAVIKRGRTSGYTNGHINGVETYVRFPGTPQFEMHSRELTVVGARAVSFSKGGDSGAFVIRQRGGELVGVLWGGFRSEEGTFVTPIKAIAKSIFEKMGVRVRLPGGDVIDID